MEKGLRKIEIDILYGGSEKKLRHEKKFIGRMDLILFLLQRNTGIGFMIKTT